VYIPDLKLGKYLTAAQIPLTCVEPANTHTPVPTATPYGDLVATNGYFSSAVTTGELGVSDELTVVPGLFSYGTSSGTDSLSYYMNPLGMGGSMDAVSVFGEQQVGYYLQNAENPLIQLYVQTQKEGDERDNYVEITTNGVRLYSMAVPSPSVVPTPNWLTVNNDGTSSSGDVISNAEYGTPVTLAAVATMAYHDTHTPVPTATPNETIPAIQTMEAQAQQTIQAHATEYAALVSTATWIPGTYVNVAGDTMTGSLDIYVPTSSVPLRAVGAPTQTNNLLELGVGPTPTFVFNVSPAGAVSLYSYVGDTSAGESLYINRDADEGSAYGRLYVDSVKSFYFLAQYNGFFQSGQNIYLHSGSGAGIYAKIGSNNGSTAFNFRDSSNNVIASIDSIGNIFSESVSTGPVTATSIYIDATPTPVVPVAGVTLIFKGGVCTGVNP